MQPKSTLNSNHAGALSSKYFTLLSQTYMSTSRNHSAETGWLSKLQFGRLLAAIMDLQRRGRGAQPPNKTGSLGAHGSKSSAKIDHIQVNKMGIVTVVKCPEVAVILIQTQ